MIKLFYLFLRGLSMVFFWELLPHEYKCSSFDKQCRANQQRTESTPQSRGVFCLYRPRGSVFGLDGVSWARSASASS